MDHNAAEQQRDIHGKLVAQGASACSLHFSFCFLSQCMCLVKQPCEIQFSFNRRFSSHARFTEPIL